MYLAAKNGNDIQKRLRGGFIGLFRPQWRHRRLRPSWVDNEPTALLDVSSGLHHWLEPLSWHLYLSILHMLHLRRSHGTFSGLRHVLTNPDRYHSFPFRRIMCVDQRYALSLVSLQWLGHSSLLYFLFKNFELPPLHRDTRWCRHVAQNPYIRPNTFNLHSWCCDAVA